jgi:hypothetical protein
MNYKEIIDNGGLLYTSQSSDTRLTTWLLNSIQLDVSFFREVPLSPIDKLICSLLDNANGQISKEELGLTLGFDIATKKYNNQAFYIDEAECEMYNRLLKQVEEWSLISIDNTVDVENSDDNPSDENQEEGLDESTSIKSIEIVKLTNLGKYALDKNTKFTFHKSEVLLYSNMLSTGDKSVDDLFSYPKELDVYAKVLSTKQSTINPNDFDFSLNSQFQERLFLQLGADWNGQIFSIEQRNIIHPMHKCYVEYKLYNYENELYIIAFKNGLLSQKLTDILYAECNKKARLQRIKRSLYYRLINNPASSFKYEEVAPFWDIVEEEEYDHLIKDNRLDWSDSSLFELIIGSDSYVTSKKALITKLVPRDILKSYILKYQEKLDWIVLSSRIDIPFVLENSMCPWSFSTILNRNDISIDEAQQILKLPVLSNEELEWDLIEKYLTKEFVKNNIDNFKFDHYHLTSWLSTDSLDIVFSHIDKQWNWDYLSNNLTLEQIEENINEIESHLNVISLIDRCFNDVTNIEFAINSSKFKKLFEDSIADGRFNNYSLQDKSNYVWTDPTIKYFEEIGLLSWESKQYEKGFAQFVFVKWTKDFFAKYHSRITCQQDKTFISSTISDINILIEYPEFDWDWSALSQNINIAYSDLFIDKYIQKIDVHSWIRNATNIVIEEYFDRLNLKMVLNNEASVKTLSEKASQSFISKHRELSWNGAEFTNALLPEALSNKDIFTNYMSRWDWSILSLNAPLPFILDNIECPWSSLVLTKAILLNSSNVTKLLSKYSDRVDWDILSEDIKFNDFCLLADSFGDKWNWDIVNQRFVSLYTSSILNNEQLQDKLDWNAISSCADASELIKALALNISYINWEYATLNVCPVLTLDLLKDESYIKKWDWQIITQYAALPLLEEAICYEEIPLLWDILTKRFSADFILRNLAKYQDKWDWGIIWNTKFTFAYVSENQEMLSKALNSLNIGNSNLQWTSMTNLYINEDILSLCEVLNPSNGYNWNYKLIYDKVQDLEQYVNQPHFYIDWSALSKSSAADKLFSYDSEIFDIRIWKVWAKKILSNPMYNWDYKALTQLNSIQKEHNIFFKQDIEKWDWDYISEFGLCLLPKNNGDANLRKYKNNINFALLSKRTDISLNEYTIGGFIDEQWDWSALSANESVELSIDFVYSHKDKNWDWKALSCNPSIKWSSKNTQIFKDESIIDAINWEMFLARKDLRIDSKFLKITHDKIKNYWAILTSNKRFIPSIEAISIAGEDGVNLTTLNWDVISESKSLIQYKKEDDKSVPKYDFIKKYACYINWEIATQNSTFDILNDSLLDSFKDYVDWSFISREMEEEKLTVSYLKRYKKYLNWFIINERFDYNLLNEVALKDLENYLDWSRVSLLNFEFTNELLSAYVDKWDWSNLMHNNSFQLAFGSQDLSLYQHKVNVAKFIEKFDERPGKIYHFTHLFNVLEVLKSRKILSRNRALELSKLKFDSAGGVVGRTAKAHSFARFYYRPSTPTQFYNECLGWDCDMTIHQGNKEKSYYSKALTLGLPKCPIPVFLEFDLKEVLSKMSSLCYYSDGNMQTNWANVYKVEDAPDNLRMKYIYNSMGDAYGITLSENEGVYDPMFFSQVIDSIKEQSQQEFLVKDEFDFNNINSLKIHCYDENSAKLLKKYLGKDPIAEKIVVGGCFIYQNRDLDFSIDEDNNTITISSSYNGQGDAYFLVKGNVKVINTKDIKREIKEGIVMYPTVEVEKTDEAFEIYFIDKRARTTDWLVYTNNFEAQSITQVKQYHINDNILDSFKNIKDRINIELNSGLFYTNMLNSYHGIAHTSRVLFATHLITSMSDELSDSLRDVAYYAAIIHDLGKTSDREGSIHGLKSMNRYSNFIDTLDMDISLKLRLKDAIRYHSVEDSLCPKHVQDDILWKILKDADALDRSRFGGRGCDIKYLRLPIFKTEKGQEILGLTSIMPKLTSNCKWDEPYSDIINTLKSYVL